MLDPAGSGAATVIEPKPGDMVPLRQPIQGGFVLYAGAHLRNLDPCQVTLRAQLKDAQTGKVISNLDQRQADLEPAPPPHAGWWRPKQLDSLSTVPNIPACPDALGWGAEGKAALIELIATDRGNRTAKLDHAVQPVCPANAIQADCHCSCGPDFFPGKCSVLGDGGARGDGG